MKIARLHKDQYGVWRPKFVGDDVTAHELANLPDFDHLNNDDWQQAEDSDDGVTFCDLVGDDGERYRLWRGPEGE